LFPLAERYSAGEKANGRVGDGEETMDAIRAVGVVGLGRMGRPIARHLVTAGFAVHGYDRRLEEAEACSADGVTIVANAAEVASASDLVIVVVGFEGQVDDVVFGKDGLGDGLRPGTVVAIASTVSPTFLIRLQERLATTGARLIDAPLVRGEAAAEAGRLVVYAGGDDSDIGRCRPVFDAFAEHVFRLGGPGTGQVAKAVNNMLLWTCLCADIEGLDFAQAFGVDREALRAALALGSGANWALETRADERPALWAEKDLAIVLDEASKAGVGMPVTATVKDAIAAFKAARGLATPAEPA
jgi:3-hydroxyisobutyrate dehydrogenase-like beta-hydroxyacid dehydrogenase